jgi:hypothetical protein
LFESVEQADESTRVAAAWVRDEKLEMVLPNAPEVTTGEVIVTRTACPSSPKSLANRYRNAGQGSLAGSSPGSIRQVSSPELEMNANVKLPSRTRAREKQNERGP